MTATPPPEDDDRDIMYTPLEGITICRKDGKWSFQADGVVDVMTVIHKLRENGRRLKERGTYQLQAADALEKELKE